MTLDSGRRAALVLALFFCSGACALTYQVLWLRLLATVFGVTVYAASTVLAAFMSGLAAGSLVAGPLLRRVRRPLLMFGLAEILVGASALATAPALDAAALIYERLHRAAADRLGLLTAARFLVSFVVLLVPTVLMGLTLPVLTAARAVRETRFGSRLGALYAVNTFGALVGAALTGFVLIGALGIRASFLLAAALNVAVGLGALLLRRDRAAADLAAGGEVTESPRPVSPARDGDLMALVVTLSGLAALALEVVWFRLLAQFLDATTYAFTTMLATVLAGIAVGGGVASWLLRRDREWSTWLSGLQGATAVAALASPAFLAWSYASGWRTAGEVPASIAAILPAALLMGVSFPIALRAGIRPAEASDPVATARRVGRLYALNVAGAVAGALLGGFVLVPRLGTRRALIALAGVYLATAWLLAWRARPRRPVVLGAGLAAVVFAFTASRLPDPFAAAVERRHGAGTRELWRHDGVQNAVSVHESGSARILYVDGLHQAEDTPEVVRLHRVIGHLPMVLHPAPADVLVVGLGGGATPGAVSQHPGARVQVVELSEGVRRAAPFFAHVSYDVLRQPGVALRMDDGRNFLRLSGRRFDVITADLIRPHHAGGGLLYSREYFQLVRAALRDDGIALQWTGHGSGRQYRLVMRTFLDVFPHATLWYGGRLMAGSPRPLRVSARAFESRRAVARTRAALDEVGLRDFGALAGWYTAGPAEMRAFVGAGPLLTDDQPLVEYYRSLPRGEPPGDPDVPRGAFAPLVGP